MCNSCFSASDLANMPVVVRDDLAEYEDVNSDIEMEIPDETF